MFEPASVSAIHEPSRNGVVDPRLHKKKMPVWRVGPALDKKMLRLLAEARKKSQ